MQKKELEIKKVSIRNRNPGDSEYFLPVILYEVKYSIPFNNTSRWNDDFVNELTIGKLRDTDIINFFIVKGVLFPLGWN